MSVVEALRLAVQGLSANRLRSALTMLGILIGVSAVILLVAVGNGATIQVQAQIGALGSNIIYVYPQNSRVGGVAQGFGSGSSLSQADVTALKDQSQAPDIVTAIPITGAPGNLVYGNQNWQAQVQGSTADFASVRNYDLAEGSFFTAEQVNSNARVAVIGQTVAQNLFTDGSDPVGQSIKIQRQSFRVIGVFASKGASGFGGGNQDNIVSVPITSAWAYLLGGRGKNINQIIIQARSTDAIPNAEKEATAILDNTHKVADPTNPDFQMISQQDILNTASSITGVLTVLLGSIAAISLVVGGIGIMNIMLVTVTERTREIGIRKAIGAKRSDILLQFLIESMFLSGLGGLAGIALGWLGSIELPHVSSSLPAPVVSGPSVLLAFGVSVGIGLFFGIYPANRAATLRPIEALRYE